MTPRFFENGWLPFARSGGVAVVLVVSCVLWPIACAADGESEDVVMLNVGVTGAGDIISRPAGVTCSGGRCGGEFFRGDVVQLAALPLVGWVFDGWEGDCITDADDAPNFAAIEVQGANDTCNATFRRWAVGDPLTDPVNFILSIEGPGSILVTPGDEICRAQTSCSVTVQRGARVQLEVASRRGAFESWGGGCSGSNPDSGVDVNDDVACTATFDDAVYFPYRFEVLGEGSVTSMPPGINCGNGNDACEYEFRENSAVTISAFGASGWSFVEWGHQCVDAAGQGLTTSSLNALAVYGYACTALFVEGDGPGGPDIPAAWQCAASFYAAGDGCDCGCGAFDPDCVSGLASACDYCTGCAEDTTCPSNINPNDNSTCDTGGDVPAAWTCTEGWYGDLSCDCGCGAVDIDCDSSLATSCLFCDECGSCDDVNPTDNAQCQ